MSIAILIRAHDESSTKADRIAKKWALKRVEAEQGQIMTAMAPAWLKPNKDKSAWIIDTKKVAVVRRIFELALAGNGTPTIARVFNDEGIPTMKRAHSWTFGVVNAILKNPAVVGIFAPRAADQDPIPGYYPAIIEDVQYQRVREMLIKRMWVGGRSGERVANLFAGISFCEACGSRMRAKSTAKSAGKSLTYVQCMLSYSRGGCDARVFPYYAAERAILRFLADDLSEMVLQINSDAGEDPRAGLETERSDLNQRVTNLVTMLETVPSPQLGERINKLQEKIDKIDEQLGKLIDSRTVIIGVQEVAELFDRMKGFGDALDVEERRKVQIALRRVIDEVHFMSDRGDGRPTVAVKYLEHLGWSSTHLDVKAFMEKVGGNRRLLRH